MTTRDEAVKLLNTELGSLNEGTSHPDSTAWLFVLYVLKLKDATLLELAPHDIQEKIARVLDEFERDGYRHAYSGKGVFLDLTMETKAFLKIVRGKERAAVVNLGPHCECDFCSKQVWSEGAMVMAVGNIYHEPHEGASFGFCGKCERPYLVYWVEARDEMFRYHCPLSNDEYGRLREAVANGGITSVELSALIRNTEVFFISPWEAKWINGGRVLVEPRPW